MAVNAEHVLARCIHIELELRGCFHHIAVYTKDIQCALTRISHAF